jgi:hypothetical protein
VAAAWTLSPGGWFAEQVQSGEPDGAPRLCGHPAGSSDYRGHAAGDPGDGCRAAVLVPQLPLAGLGQHLVVVFAGQLADAVGMVNMAVSCLSEAGRAGRPSPDRLARSGVCGAGAS